MIIMKVVSVWSRGDEHVGPRAACGLQKNFVRPTKHSGETSSLELCLTCF